MIEIIKKGQLPEGEMPEEKRYEATCPDCGTVFSFDISDTIKEIDVYFRMRVHHYVECPLCKYNVNITNRQDIDFPE